MKEETHAASNPGGTPEVFDDPLHGLEELPEDPVDAARSQLAFLEDGLDPEAGPNPGLMDEAYRAAHLLLRAIDPARVPNVARIAAQVQSLVLATRSGTVSLGPALPILLRTAARAARVSLESSRKGKSEPAAAREAADALEAFLTGAPAAAAVGEGPVRYEKVEKRRLEAARAALQAAGPATSYFSGALEEAAALDTTMRGLTSQRLALTAELLAELPESLAAAARGEPVTSIAADLAGRFDRLGTLLSEGEESVSRLSARIRQSGETGLRAAEAVESAVRRLDGVGLRNVLYGLPAVAAAAARAGSLDVSALVDLGDFEIRAELAPLARAAALQCIRTLCARAGAGRKQVEKAAGKGKTAEKTPGSGPNAPHTLTVTAEEKAGSLRVLFRLRGASHPAGFVQSRLRLLSERLGRNGCSLTIEPARGNDSSVMLTFPGVEAGAPEENGFVIVRARGVLHAIPAAAVEECIAAKKPGELYMRAGRQLRSLALGDPDSAGSAVVVKTGASGGLVIVVDELVGKETLRMAEGEKGAPRSGIRGDGSRALIVDLAGKAGAKRPNA